jgi:hypothetical protein
MVAHEMRLSPRCDTAKKEAMCKEWLVGATEMALAALVMQMPTPIHITTILAKAIRDLAPDEYNAWADLQLSSSVSLAMVVAMRDFTDLPRERLIEDNLEKGHLAAGAVSLLSNQMLNLIGILRPKLESELGVKTTDEQLDLDLALDAFLMARRIKAMGESLVGSIPKYSNVTKGLKLIDEAERHDNLFQTRLDKLRTRIQKRARKIKVGARTNVPIKVGAPTTEEPPQAEVASA